MNRINRANQLMVDTGVMPGFEPNESHWCAMIFGFFIYVFLVFGASYGNAELVNDLIENSYEPKVLIASVVITLIFSIIPLITICCFFSSKIKQNCNCLEHNQQ